MLDSRRGRIVVTAVAICCAVACAAAAGAAVGGSNARITVYAASSLTDALPAIDAKAKYSFGGSSALAAQIMSGAPADVFASANTSIPAQLYAKGLIEKPVRFASNSLVIVVPVSNPAKIRSVRDLTKRGVKVDLANPAVPVGSYTLQALQNLKLKAKVTANVVSQETDVRSVLAKVALGQADAGFVYSTDAKTVPGKVKVIRLPARAQPNVAYALAVVARSAHKEAARAFVRLVTGKAGQARLARYGFLTVAEK